MPSDATPNRRDLVTGRILRGSDDSGSGLPIADSPIGHLKTPPPDSGDTLRLTARAMACDFSIIMNAGEQEAIWSSSTALDYVGELESQLSVYREDSEVTQLNNLAFTDAQVVESGLFGLLQLAERLSHATNGAFDLTSDPLIRLWKICREETRVPADDELAAAFTSVGMQHVKLDADNRSVEFHQERTSINLGAIGKGYALDRVADRLGTENDFLLHGGHSSLIAHGSHTGAHIPSKNGTESTSIDGWPVGIGNPLITNKRLGTIVLRDQAMATSGSNIQYFRVGEKRYGHILDPRTGWPAEGHLSVTVIAPTAAEADALSTAFYVMTPEEVDDYCDKHTHIGTIMIPFPERDRRVTPAVIGMDVNAIFWDPDQVKQSE